MFINDFEYWYWFDCFIDLKAQKFTIIGVCFGKGFILDCRLTSKRFSMGKIYLLILSSNYLFAPLCFAENIIFSEISAEVGIDFKHHNGVSEEKRLPETDGSGGAFFDYDGDGDLDLYLVNSGDLIKGRSGHWDRLYENVDMGKRFNDVSKDAEVSGRDYGMGVVTADYDNDGDADIYLTNWGMDQLYKNLGNAKFADKTLEAGLGNKEWGSSASFFDSDNDGDLDLFVVNYVNFTLQNHPWCGHEALDLRFYCDPRQHQPVRDYLYINDGKEGFLERGKELGIVEKGNGLGVACWDYDKDGDQDIYVANDMEANFLYENDGGGKFTENGLFAGVAMSADGLAQAGMGVDTADYDNDGDIDLFVTNYQLENNALYRNEGTVFSEESFSTGIGEFSLNYLGFGSLFVDYDNDGWTDIFVVNGHVHDNIEVYDELVTYAQHAQLFRNIKGQFIEREVKSEDAFEQKFVGRGALYADYDADGDIDLAVTSSGRKFALFQNNGGNTNNWLKVKLRGSTSNRDAVGALVELWTNNRRQIKQVKAGSGYQSSNPKILHFGLGTNEIVDSLKVIWPIGSSEVISSIESNSLIDLVENHP